MNPFVSVFWQEKSSKMTCIFVLTWKFKQIYLNLCFNKRNQYLQATFNIFPNTICFLTGRTGTENWFEFCVLTSKIKSANMDSIREAKERSYPWTKVKSNKFICIFVLTGKIQPIDLNFCSDIQCLKSQTFSNFDPKTAWISWQKWRGKLMEPKAATYFLISIGL